MLHCTAQKYIVVATRTKANSGKKVSNLISKHRYRLVCRWSVRSAPQTGYLARSKADHGTSSRFALGNLTELYYQVVALTLHFPYKLRTTQNFKH